MSGSPPQRVAVVTANGRKVPFLMYAIPPFGRDLEACDLDRPPTRAHRFAAARPALISPISTAGGMPCANRTKSV